MKWAQLLMVASTIEMASGQQLNWLMTVMRCVWPSDGGRGPMIIEMNTAKPPVRNCPFGQRGLGMWADFGGLAGLVPVLNMWHTKCSVMALSMGLVLVWARLWKVSIIALVLPFFCASGGGPVDS